MKTKHPSLYNQPTSSNLQPPYPLHFSIPLGLPVSSKFKISKNRLCKFYLRIVLFFGCVIPSVVTLGQSEESDRTYIILNPQISLNINNFDEVQEPFGIMSAEYNPDAAQWVREANISGVRDLYPDIAPSWRDPLSYKRPSWSVDNKFLTKEASFEWTDNFFSTETHPNPHELWTNILTATGRVRNHFDGTFGNHTTVTIGMPLNVFDGRMIRNPEGAANHIIAYIQALKDFEASGSGPKLKYVEIHNEPDMPHNWTGMYIDELGSNRSAKARMAEEYARIVNQIQDSVSEAHPDVNFVHMCTMASSTFNTSEKWDLFIKPFLDGVYDGKVLEYFSAHNYLVPPSRSLAFMGLMQNYNLLKHDVKTRFIITESSMFFERFNNREKMKNTFLYHASDIFYALKNPDKYASRNAFAIGGFGNGNDNLEIFGQVNGQLVPSASYAVLWALQNLRGKMVFLNVKDDSTEAFASRPDDKTIVLSIFNPLDYPKQVSIDLNVNLLHIDSVTQREGRFVDNPSTLYGALEKFDIAVESSVLDITVKEHSITSIEIDLKDTLPILNQAKIQEFFGNTVNQPRNLNIDAIVGLPRLPALDESVILRIAFEDRMVEGIFDCQVNGKAYQKKWADTPVKVFETDKTGVEKRASDAGIIEISIDPLDLSGETMIQIPAINNRFLYASIIYQSKPDKENGENDKTWAGFPLREDGLINTGDFMGWLYVAANPYVFSYTLSKYLYLPESAIKNSGAWIYMLR